MKKNSISSQLQQMQEKREKDKQQQEMISSSVTGSEDGSANHGGQFMNMPSGASFMSGPMFNPMMMQAGNQFMMPGMMGNGNQMVPGMPGMMAGTGMPTLQQNGSVANHTPNDNMGAQGEGNVNNLNRSTDESDAGLLQLAMQDAGITPSSAASQTSSAALTPSIAESHESHESSHISQNNPLQTLATVATSNHEMLTESSASDAQNYPIGSASASNQQVSMTSSMTSSQAGMANMLSTGGQPMMNMAGVGPGQQQMQQIMFINEQGIPCIAQVPVGIDPNNPNMIQSAQKQGLMSVQNQQAIIKDQSGNIDQNQALALAQQQAMLQNQFLGQGGGGNFQNLLQQQQQQQQGLLQGNIIQTPNGPILQQIGPQMQGQLQGQGHIIGMNSQGQSIMVAGQQGQMTLNVPGQHSQLPSALILPNGQIVPVVTNPGNVPGGEGQLLSGPGSQNLLMAATSSTAASLSTSVIPTSAMNSVMCTQIQGSTMQSQKMVNASMSGSQASFSTSTQPKLTGVQTPPNMMGLQAGNKTSATPILISLPINGQLTTVVLDPVTMQVLGTVNPGQPAGQNPVQSMGTSTGQITSNPITSAPVPTPAQSVPTTSAGGKKNSKNNQNQRAICPKPLGADGLPRVSGGPSKKKKSSKSSTKGKESIQPDSLSDSLQIQIPESTTDPETVSAISSESTDILAKAAESIFSSPSGEGTTVGGFFNDANDDNPLHIDTSVTEVEDENKSPSKQLKKTGQTSSTGGGLKEAVLGLNSVADGGKAIKVSTTVTKVVNSVSPVVSTPSVVNTDSVTSLSNTLEEIAGGLDFGDITDNVAQVSNKSGSVFPSNEKQKKSKSSKNSEGKKDMGPKPSKSSKSKANTSKKQSNVVNSKGKVPEVEKMDSDSQMDIESTLIHIPDNIEFSPNDLSDVLDQVEQMGSTDMDSPSSKVGKKSKSKRSKAPDSESEPSAKKRKSSKEPVKESKVNNSRELLSMPANLSVYDFDDSDSIVPSLLPLSGKDFSSSLPGTPAKPDCLLTGGNEKSEDKNKSSAQNKQKTNSQTQKAAVTKNVKTSCSKENNVSLVFNSSDNAENKLTIRDNSKTAETKSDTSDVNNKISESLPIMPDIDTTTSLFGFPVPSKKLPRPETQTTNRQTSSKPAPQQSNKPSPQPNNNSMVSPKQALVSPKSNASTTVSPAPLGSFSTELVSPKLSIVSPSQGIMSDNESITSPKHNFMKDTSPMKKPSPPDKFDDIKVSSFSALNNVPVLDVNTKVASGGSGIDEKNKQPSVTCSPVKGSGENTSSKSMTTSNNDITKPTENPAKIDDSSNMNKGNLSDNLKVPIDQSNTSNMNSNANSNSNNSRKSHQSNRNPNTGMDGPFTPQMTLGSSLRNQSSSSMNSSQNNRYGPTFGSDPGYGAMSALSHGMPNDNVSKSGPGMGNYPVPYSADSLFNTQAEKVIKSPPNVNISTLNQPKPDNPMSKVRNNAYSVDSFVQNSRDDGMRHRPDSLATHAGMLPGSDFPNQGGDLPRIPTESSPDFPNISLNLPPITSTAGNFMDNTSSGPSTNNLNSFSFSLSTTSTTVSTATGSMAQHQFPFFPPVLSSASNPPASQSGLPSSMPGMHMFDHNRGASDQMPRGNNVMHPPAGDMGRDSMSRSDKSQAVMSDEGVRHSAAGKPSCSKQKMQKASGPATIQDPYPLPYNITSSTHDNNFFRDPQMKSNIGKSPTEQMRKSQDKPMDMGGPPSRSSSQDKRGSTMERSPQMHNNPQSYYSSSYQPPKSLNTAPLHHPPGMMPQDERGRNMTRSPYETPFALPQASQFNPMVPGFPPANRFDSGPPSFSRDNSGTQPLSHTPVNAGGRKSANPQAPQASVVKPPQKQAAPPLVPMNGGGSQPPRPTPPQSHRSTTPIANAPSQPNPQVSQTRQAKQPSRSSKHPSSSSSKKSKALPFMEVDSNLSNSIFETNRSMTPMAPFFQSMQNLSPQSRAMQHEGPHFQPGNFFGLGPRFPNSNTPVPKNTEIGPPFGNPFMPTRGSQNAPLGLNFQPGFGMNPLHGNHSNAPQLTPHTAPHMGNFNLNNIFSDGASQNEPSLPISPIKFGHTNYQGMEHNAMQHHHQYNRGHPGVMSLNSILGSNHHGFDGRMPTSMAGPFHSHGHPSFIPPLNFSMHDH
ncbi:hypothetical protein MAR_020545 [Mya arenaria]|uniref:Nuclear receptor coactivator 6 TRADD-N domain-containing protein n=1 Tax=Mya arenaria TaxID=6604 RepID=A0ABY7E9A2_MYAAR|nr:hypothetical protein MAR_020545 [Mya arenaria]